MQEMLKKSDSVPGRKNKDRNLLFSRLEQLQIVDRPEQSVRLSRLRNLHKLRLLLREVDCDLGRLRLLLLEWLAPGLSIR